MMPVKHMQYALIIDRTLPGIYSAGRMSRLDILDFCRLLDSAGVDIIEIDSCVMGKIGKVPKGLDFILEVETAGELYEWMDTGIRRVLLRPALFLSQGVPDFLVNKSLSAVLEINVDSFDDLKRLDEIIEKGGLTSISCIRLAGLGKTSSHRWLDKAEHIRNLTGKSLDICPEYSMSTGNAMLQEAAAGRADFVTSAFAGYGRDRSFASTEILLVALKVLYADPRESNLAVLPELKALFEKYTNQKVSDNFPVIGKSIFMCESGIHAAGIRNSPKTYEPYGPDIVGQKRELVIGKHSGRRSISAKLTELGMLVDEVDLAKILERVRELSTEMNRSLSEDEFICICMQYSVKGYRVAEKG